MRNILKKVLLTEKTPDFFLAETDVGLFSIKNVMQRRHICSNCSLESI